MKFFKPGKLIAFALAAILSTASATLTAPLSAATYRDVPATHWGYNAINRVTDLGFMSGDLSGNFNPNGYIDKFETTKILAGMAGYKYTGATAAEQAYYNSCYNKHIGFINLYVRRFNLWNSTVNKEIAFLLEKGILTNDDLNQFVVIVNDRESLRALSREEVSVFFVRLMGRTSQVTNASSNLFKDDASIATAYKPYVYYLRSIGVVSGDANNNFSPKGAVVKAAMASMVNTVWNIMNPSTAPAPTTPPVTTPSPNPSPTAPTANYTTVSGKIGKLYLDFRAVQISSSDANNNKIFPTTAAVSITIDGAAKALADLREGMSFTGVTLNGELISIAATSAQTPAPTAAPAPTSAPGSTTGTSVLEGTVTVAQTKSVSIEIRMLNNRGEVYTEIRTLAIPDNCVITRGGKTTIPLAITKGDIAKATLVNGVLQKLELQEKDRRFSGELISKRENTTTTGTLAILTIKDSTGTLNELVVTTSSSLRRGSNASTWQNLRIGDTVDVTAEYDKLLTLAATGKASTLDGFVREIRITAAGCELTIEDMNKKTAVYPVLTGLINPYDFRVGAKLRLQLDSKEISGFSILQDADTLGYTGTITRLNATLIEIRDASTGAKREFTINSQTVVREASTNKIINLNRLDLNMSVSISADPATSTQARTITVLAY